MTIKKPYFNIDGSDYYEGYYDKNVRWNGWAIPFFEKDIADIISRNFSSPDYLIVYDKEIDSYICNSLENGKVVESYIANKLILDTIDGKKELYDFGSAGWTWDDYSIDELNRLKDIKIYTIEENKEDMDIEY